MELNEYQNRAAVTAIYPEEYQITYPLIGLIAEVGEFSNKYKKVLRDNTAIDRENAVAELGDVLWYLSAISNDMGISLDEIATKNLYKLEDRKNRGVLSGSGDNR